MGQRRHVGLTAGWTVVIAAIAAVAAVGLIRLGHAVAEPSIVPGSYTITITGGDGAIGIQALKLAPGCSNGSDDDLDTKIDYPADPECASASDSNEGPDNTPYVPPTFTVDVDAAGNVSAPASDVHWQDIWQRQDAAPLGVKDLLVQFKADDVAGKSVTGHVDAATGAIALTWHFHIQTSIVGLPGTLLVGSPAMPLTANLSSDGAGGAALDPEALTATLVDSAIVYPAATCVNNLLLCPTMVSLANTRLGLPTEAGQSPLKVNGAIDRSPIQDGTTPADAPDLKVVKSHEGDFEVGAEGSYTLAVSNVGTAATSGQITLGDLLPEGMSYVSAAGDGWLCTTADSQTVGCLSSATVPAGAAAEPVTVTVMPGASGTLTNVADVSVEGDPNADNDSSSDPTNVIGGTEPEEPDLTLAKSHAGDFEVGTASSYSLTVSNEGTAATQGDVVVADTLPDGMSFVSAAGSGWGCTDDGQEVTCTSSAPIAAGAAAPVVTLTVTPTETGTVTNVATVSGGGESNILNNGASDPTNVNEAGVAAVDLTLSKTHKAGFTAGTPGSYDLVVSNAGTAASSGDVVVSDSLPEAMAFVSGTGTGWGCTADGQEVTCTSSASIGPGAPGETLTITVTPALAGSFTNVATVSGGGQTNTLNDGAADPTQVDPAPAPNLAVDVVAPPMTVGSAATIVVKVANVGTGPTTGPVNLTLPLPTVFALTNATGPGWNCSNAGANESVLNIACVTQATVAPGNLLPAINVAVTPKTAGTFDIGAKVSTDGDLSTADDTKVVQVEVAATTTPGDGSGDTASEMPFTGGDIGLIVAAALVALGTGGGLVRVSRRRSRLA